MQNFVWYFFVGCIFVNSAHVQEFRIGGIFAEEDQEIAFRLAVNKVNKNLFNRPYRLVADTQSVDTTNTLLVYRSTCTLFQNGIIGLFGPSSLYSSSYIQAISDRKEIPHIEVNWNPKLNRSSCCVNLHPHSDKLYDVFVDIIYKYGWQRMTLLYENNESLLRISKLLSTNGYEGRVITLKQLVSDVGGNYRPVLNELKRSGETNFILECSNEILSDILTQAQQVGIMTEKYNYIITNLDLQTIDLTAFQFGGTNITGVRLVNPEDKAVIAISEEIQEVRAQLGKSSHTFGLAAWKLKVETALLVDAVQLFYSSIVNLIEDKDIKLTSKIMQCNNTDNWKFGYTIMNYMKRNTLNGLTSLVKFDNEGFRKDFLIDIIELNVGGILKIGDWNSTTRALNISHTNALFDEPKLEEGSLLNKTFVIITCLTPPYGMLKETTTQLTGNERFEGFCIDLIQDLSQMLGFNYTFVIQEDGANGNFDSATGQWNGMIKEIIDDRAHLAITDLTITSERESAVDFTMPFMNLGISILYRKPEPVPPSLFMFASPFSFSVWLMLGVAYILVSLAFFVMGRISPSEWNNPYPCVEEPEFLINQFSIRNCFWFTIGSLMQQGSDLAPIAISTRTASGVWWFFTLIMVSSYTANLAAFLTVETLVTSFSNIEELVNQKEIKYGAKKGGATANFFRDSNVSTYIKVWHHMQNKDEHVMTNDNDEGVNKVETENYAFLMESTSIEYVVERHCALARVGSLLDDKGYGIAMKKNSPYRNSLSTAILKLQETGRLTDLKIKWWKEKRGGGNCATKSEGGEATPLNLQNVGGVFLVLFIGTLLGLIGSSIELMVHLYKKSKSQNKTLSEKIREEFHFFLRFKNNVREIAPEEVEDDTSKIVRY